MRALKRRDPQTYREIDALFERIEQTPDLGYELHGEWGGCMAVHCGRDRYRVIWKVLDPEEDYTRVADLVVPVVVIAVGPKTDSRGRTIYERPR